MSELVERVGPEIFRFDKPGNSIRGVLSEIDFVEISGRPTIRYLILDPTEKRPWSVLGTVDLNRKIRQSDVGRFLEIHFDGLEVVEGKRPIKRFRVLA
jgi:hypothetical protein